MQETLEKGVRSLNQEDPLEEGIQPTPVFLFGKYYPIEMVQFPFLDA